jgi:Tol biopolymer transport system component
LFMRSGSPAGYTIVVYFFVITVVMAFLSLASPVTFGAVREIPQSPLWGEPVMVDEVSPVVRIPSCVIDSEGTAHVVYLDKSNGYTDVFYATIKDRTVSEPQNLTGYPSLKESVVACMDSAENVYAAFLDNRNGRWQVFLLTVNERDIVQITDTDTHKEDVSITICGNTLMITWTEVDNGLPQIFMALYDSHNKFVTTISREHPSTKASIYCDGEKIHVVYLEKRVYDHVIYTQMTLSGEQNVIQDLGECIHLDPVLLGIFKGPQFAVGETTTFVWSDSSTGSQNLYYVEMTESEFTNPQKLTDYPLGAWSWMPSIVEYGGTTHIIYVNNAYGHRLFHSQVTQDFKELGTITSERERATAPFLTCDDKGFLHCVYLQFTGDTFHLVYRNTYPHEEVESPFSERFKASSITYVYSFVLSFLFSFPLAAKSNFLGICVIVVGFAAFRFLNLQKYFAVYKKSEYVLLGLYLVVLSLLRGPIEYSFLNLVAYESLFVGYGFLVSAIASFIFKYLLRERFDSEVRMLLSCLVFLYSITFFLVLPVIPYM